MPTVLRWRGYRFFWYAADAHEPPHVHIYKDGMECKVWIVDLRVAFNHGYPPDDLRMIVAETKQHRDSLLETWNEQFGR